MTVRLVSNEKIAETSSKGNQEKWLDNGKWYKLDQFGYEALAETFTSMLLEYSNIEKDTPFCFTRYNMERLLVHGRERTGCSSDNFLRAGESIVTISHLFKQHLGGSLVDVLERLPSDKRRMMYIAEATADITGLQGFPQYLTLLFEIDALVLNDDRHLNNIAVIVQNGQFDYCPIFDQGAGLLSNVMYSPMDIIPKALITNVKQDHLIPHSIVRLRLCRAYTADNFTFLNLPAGNCIAWLNRYCRIMRQEIKPLLRIAFVRQF